MKPPTSRWLLIGGLLLASARPADSFLGTRGDPWDTQKDLATAVVGAVTALVTLTPWHDRALGRMGYSLTEGADVQRLLS
jgi:putative membrane protein